MYKIEISDIRKQAYDLITLNEGYLIYQQNKVKDARLVHDATKNYDYIVTADVEGAGEITLYVKKDSAKGTCLCKDHLCKHEIALFFVLRDMVVHIMQNKDELKMYEDTGNIDSIVKDIYKKTLINKYNKLKILPTIDLEDFDSKLFLDLKLDDMRVKVKNISDFIFNVTNSNEAFFKNKYINVGLDNFEEKSRTFFNLIRNLKVTGINTLELKYPLMDDIYNLYNEYLYVFNGYSTVRYDFCLDNFPLTIKLINKELRINDRSYKIIEGSKYIYIFYNEKIYVSSNKVLGIILNYLKEKNSISFNKNTYDTFLINIYPYIKEYVDGVDYCYNLNIDTFLDYDGINLILNYKTDIESDSFIKKSNYLNLIESIGFINDGKYKLKGISNICEFLENDLDKLKLYGEIFLNDNVKNIKIKNMPKISFSLKLEGGLLSLLSDYKDKDFEVIKLAYKNNLKYVSINNEILKLDFNNIKEILNILDDLDIDSISAKNIKLYQAFYLNSKYKDYFSIPNDLNNFYNEMEDYNNIDLNLDNKLRDYQKSGVKWLYTLARHGFGGVLADDMGLGKTYEVISLIKSLKPNKPVLIVSPSSLIFNWAEEFNKYGDGISYEVMYGLSRDPSNVKEALDNNKVIIISYETLRIDIDLYKDTLFSLEICDEAQFIKNPNALKTLAVKSVKAEVKFALTGTPLENGLLDLWSIYDFVLPGYLESKIKFMNKYESYAYDSSVLDNLNKRISPFMLRRLKGDVLDLEEKIESVIYTSMSKDESDLYNNFLVDVKENLKKDDYKMVSVLSALTRLREIACEPRLFLEDVNVKNSKLDMLEEIIDEKVSDNHKILLFTQFTSLFPYITKRLDKKGIKYLTLSGKDKPLLRVEMVDKFNSDKDIKVFLISLKAGGTGLNLTSADTVIFYDPWWNNAVMNQASDRAYRLGQENIVHVIKLINKGTIEEKILDLENKKKELFDNVISDDDIIKNISKDDLKELFS